MRTPISLLALSLLACARQQPPAPEKVAIPGTTLSFDVVALPGLPGKTGAFKIGTREVTWAEFNAYFETKDMATGVDAVTRPTRAISYFGQVGVPSHFLEAKRPLTNVRWHSAISYCDWLSKKTGGYWRLPTETEWEYAARAGETAAAPAGLDDLAWHKGNSQSRTHEGAEKKPNAFGLYDTLGNLWEYCLEFQSGTEFAPVLKGGCWSSPAKELKFALRQAIPLKWYAEDTNRPRSVWWLTASEVSIGFRVACAADASDRKEREDYAARIGVKIVGSEEKVITTGKSTEPYRAVKGEISNGGDRTLDEIELKVYYLEADGKPHFVDLSASKPGRGSFSKCWPVLVNSRGDAVARAPLKPGESRAFELYIPSSYDLDAKKGGKVEFGAAITALRFAK